MTYKNNFVHTEYSYQQIMKGESHTSMSITSISNDPREGSGFFLELKEGSEYVKAVTLCSIYHNYEVGAGKCVLPPANEDRVYYPEVFSDLAVTCKNYSALDNDGVKVKMNLICNTMVK